MNNIILHLGIRYAMSKKNKRLPSMVSVMSFIGVMLAVGTLIVTMSIMRGFHNSLTEKIIGFGAHVSIYPKHKDTNWIYAAGRVKSVDEIKHVYPVVESQGMLVFKNKKSSAGVVVQGLLFNDFSIKSNRFEKHIGDCTENAFTENSMVLTTALAMRLGIRIGDEVTLMTPDFSNTIVGTVPRSKTFKVACIVKIGMYQYDEIYSFIPISMANKLFKTGGLPTYIEAEMKDPQVADKVGTLIQQLIGNEFNVSNWKESNQTLMQALIVERTAMFFILSLFVAVAMFTIFSNLSMMVNEKQKAIAILRSMGMSGRSVGGIFFVTGFLISILGVAGGVAGGMLFANNIQAIKHFLEVVFHLDLFNPAVYFLSNLPAEVVLNDVFYVVFASMFFAFLASILPAVRAAKKQPNEILREF